MVHYAMSSFHCLYQTIPVSQMAHDVNTETPIVLEPSNLSIEALAK